MRQNILEIHEKMISLKRFYFILVVCVLVAGSLFFIYVQHHHCRLGLRFVNKDFVCNSKPVVDKRGYAKLQSEIEEIIRTEKESNKVEYVSVYFRDLANGPVFGIDEYEDFAPASLLKLPLALVYMVIGEKEPDLFSRKITFEGSDSKFVQSFDDSDLVKGSVYSIEELLSVMIAHSDNDAYQILYSYITSHYGEKIIYETYLELGILSPKDAFDEVISVRRYGSIFRALYNASLINVEFSEKLLSWLANSTFTEGLVSSIPREIHVAHKFGERTLQNGAKQFHDCGIIYYPENPYLLCVMSQGHDFDSLIKLISRISAFVYDEFNSRKL